MTHARVVPPFRSKGLLPAALAVGLVHGAALVPFGDWLSEVTVLRNYSPLWLVIPVAVVCLIPIVVLAAWAARQTRRIRPILLASLVVSFAMILSALAHGELGQADAGAIYGAPWYEVAISFAIVCGIVALLALLVRWLTLQFFAPIEQTGRLCWWCGYDLGSDAITLCPECAEPADPGRFRARWIGRWWRAFCRAGPIAAIVVVLAGAAWCTYRIATLRIPLERFIARMAPSGQEPQMWPYINHSDDLTRIGWDGGVVTHPIEGDANRFIAYAYWPRGPGPRAAAVHMRIFVCEPPTTNSFTASGISGTQNVITTPLPSSEGSIRVFADLNAEQADEVMRAGVAPASLIQALLSAADKHGWTTAPPSTWGPNYSAEDIPVDPEQHFGRPVEGRAPVKPEPGKDR